MIWSVSITLDGCVEAIVRVQADSEEEALQRGRDVDYMDVTITGHQGAEAHSAYPIDEEEVT